MTPFASILAILGALWLGAMLPGPSFIIVARKAIGQSRWDGLASAFGMGAGGMLFAGLALAGLYSLLQSVEWLYVALKIAGGAYLLYVAAGIWRNARQPFAMPDSGAPASRDGRRSSGSVSQPS